MADNHAKCYECGANITRLIRDEEDDDETNEEEGGLSKSGKELKKLLGRAGGLDNSDAEDGDDNNDTEDDVGFSPVLAPKQKDAPKEPADNSPLKPASSESARGTRSTSKSTKGKRKINSDDAKATNVAPPKKVKTENEVKSSKDETVSASKSSVPAKGAPSSSSKTTSASSAGSITEDEIRAVLLQKTGVTIQDLVAKFKSRLKGKEDKDAFAAILKTISKIRKSNGPNCVVLREVKSSKDETVSALKSSVPAKGAPSSSSKTTSVSSAGPITEDEIRSVLLQKTRVTTQDLVDKFKSRLKGKEDKHAFTAILRRISKIQKTNGPIYVVLRNK